MPEICLNAFLDLTQKTETRLSPSFGLVVHPNSFFFSGVELSPLGTAATSGLLYKPQMIDEGDC
jgi:hypothetical protein